MNEPLLNHILPRQPLLSLEKIPDQRIETVADPFPVSHDGRLYVLAEIIGYRPSGSFFKKIGVFCLDDEMQDVAYLGETWPEDDALYSYPFVYRDRNRYLLVPEVFVPFEGQVSHSLQVVQIYATSLDRFPFGWEKILEGVLRGCQAPSDKVLLREQGRWWLFCSDNARKQLLLYQSKDLHQWDPHPMNPVASHDSSLSRAGSAVLSKAVAVRPWRLGGGLLASAGEFTLPLQHKFRSDTYGGAVTLLRFHELGQERFVASLDTLPIIGEDRTRNWMAKGAHHIALVTHKGAIIATTDGYDGRRWRSAVFEMPDEVDLRPYS